MVQADKLEPSKINALLEEAKIGDKLRHPSIIRQLGVIPDSWDGHPCIGGIVQELCTGGNLFGTLG